MKFPPHADGEGARIEDEIGIAAGGTAAGLLDVDLRVEDGGSQRRQPEQPGQRDRGDEALGLTERLADHDSLHVTSLSPSGKNVHEACLNLQGIDLK